VQGSGIKVKAISGNEAKFLTNFSPAKILSKKDIQVETQGEVYIFPGMTGEVVEMVQISAVDQPAIAALVSKVYWKRFWSSMDLDDMINWILIMVQVLFIPLTIGSFVGMDRLKRLKTCCVQCCRKKKKDSRYGRGNRKELVRLTQLPKPQQITKIY
jgi:hypothetical protein